jgi:hypothetical protein
MNRLAITEGLRVWVPRLPLLLLLLGMVLLLVATQTPAYRDVQGFEAEIERINQAYESTGADAASSAFHAAHDRFGTVKWLLADLGYACLAWAVLLAAVFWRARRKGWRGITHTQRGWPVPLLLILSLALLWIGFIAGGVQPLIRGQIPWWADSLGVLYIQITSIMVLVIPLMAIPVLLGLLRRVPPFPLLARPTAPYWRTILVSVIFLPVLLVSVLLALEPWSTGGWASSPAGAVLAWLLLNSRGLLIAPSQPRAA